PGIIGRLFYGQRRVEFLTVFGDGIAVDALVVVVMCVILRVFVVTVIGGCAKCMQLRFRIDQKRAACHDGIAEFESACDEKMLGVYGGDIDVAGFEDVFVGLYVHAVDSAGLNYGSAWNEECGGRVAIRVV